MSHAPKAALKATFSVMVCAALMLVPPIRWLIYLFFLMLPLWMLNNLGVPGLGHEYEGFFILSAAAWAIIAALLWLIFFAIFYRRTKKRALASP